MAEYLWQDIDDYDAAVVSSGQDAEVDVDKGKSKSSATASYYSDHLSLTVAQPPISFHDLELQHAADRAPKLFHNFHMRLGHWLSVSLPADRLPNRQYLRYRPQDMVCTILYSPSQYSHTLFSRFLNYAFSKSTTSLL